MILTDAQWESRARDKWALLKQGKTVLACDEEMNHLERFDDEGILASVPNPERMGIYAQYKVWLAIRQGSFNRLTS